MDTIHAIRPKTTVLTSAFGEEQSVYLVRIHDIDCGEIEYEVEGPAARLLRRSLMDTRQLEDKDFVDLQVAYRYTINETGYVDEFECYLLECGNKYLVYSPGYKGTITSKDLGVVRNGFNLYLPQQDHRKAVELLSKALEDKIRNLEKRAAHFKALQPLV